TTGLRTAALDYYGGDGVRQQFTAKERDIETGLDYFINRYYASTQGRFVSPDEFTGGPAEVGMLGSGHSEKQALKYAEITNPQSLSSVGGDSSENETTLAHTVSGSRLITTEVFTS